MIIPNSLALTHPLTIEIFSKQYVVHVLTIRLTTQDNWERAEKLLLAIAHEVCTPYIREAQKHMKQLEGKNWLDAPSVEPRVTIQLPEPGKITLYLRVPSPAHRTSRTEQTILRQFASTFYGLTPPTFATSEPTHISKASPTFALPGNDNAYERESTLNNEQNLRSTNPRPITLK